MNYLATFKRNLLQTLHTAALCLMAFALGTGVALADTTEAMSQTSIRVRMPVWTEALGEVPLDEYTEEELDRMVEEFWTPERIKNAIPIELPVQDEFSRKRKSNQEDYFSAALASGPEITIVDPSLPQSGATKAKPNGKLLVYDQLKNLTYQCSGAAINGDTKRLVATAAHCIHGGPGGYLYHNWKFVPNYYYGLNSSGNYSGIAPDGVFRGTTGWMTSDWISYGVSGKGFSTDWVFIVTRADFYSNLKVVDAVGGHGMKIGGSYNFDAVLFGYPENIADGLVMQRCDAPTYKRSIGIYSFFSVNPCNFGGGASGGPWLGSYNNATGLGYLKSVSAWGPKYSNAHISGPYLSYEAWERYYYANADTGWNN